VIEDPGHLDDLPDRQHVGVLSGRIEVEEEALVTPEALCLRGLDEFRVPGAVAERAVGGGAEVDDMLQPAMRTMTASRTATEREFVPVIVRVASRDAQR